MAVSGATGRVFEFRHHDPVFAAGTRRNGVDLLKADFQVRPALVPDHARFIQSKSGTTPGVRT